jgi:purine-binding chemotaxis protein CheW
VTRLPVSLAGRAADLRLSFDRSFSEAPREGVLEVEDMLAIRLASASYALRLSEVSGLLAEKTVRRLPSPVSELLGVAGFRGAIVPVYDLRALIGHPAQGTPRWLVLAAGLPPTALAFDAFEGHLRIARTDISAAETASVGRQHVHEVLRAPDVARPIIRIASVLATIDQRAGVGAQRRER